MYQMNSCYKISNKDKCHITEASKDFFQNNLILIKIIKALYIEEFEFDRLYVDMKKYISIKRPPTMLFDRFMTYIELSIWIHSLNLTPYKASILNYSDLIKTYLRNNNNFRFINSYMKTYLDNDTEYFVIENSYSLYIDRYTFGIKKSILESMSNNELVILNEKLAEFSKIIHYLMLNEDKYTFILPNSMANKQNIFDTSLKEEKQFEFPKSLAPYAYLIKDGLSSKQIATVLNKSYRTVENSILKLREFYDIGDKTLLTKYLNLIL